MILSDLMWILQHKHLPGKHNQKLHGRAGGGIGTSSPENDLEALKASRTELRNQIRALENSLRNSYDMSDIEKADYQRWAAYSDNNTDMSLRQIKLRDVSRVILPLLSKAEALDADIDVVAQQQALNQVRSGTAPVHNVAELHKLRNAALEAGDITTVDAIADKLQEARLVAWATQKLDGVDHTVITRNPPPPAINADNFPAVAAAIQPASALAQTLREHERWGINGKGEFHADLVLDQHNKMLGLGGMPQLATKAEMDAAVNAGMVEMYRGVKGKPASAFYGTQSTSAMQLHDQFMQGAFYAGTGIYGNGTYAGYGASRDVADHYASKGEGSGVIRLALKTEARIGMVDDVVDHMNKVKNDLYDDKSLSDDTKMAIKSGILTDLGHFAAYAGYDAMDNGTGYMVILNRSAVMAEINLYDEVPEASR